MSRVHVVATFEVAAEAIETFIAVATRLLVVPTQNENGCLRYELVQDAARATHFAMLESWRDDAALDAHLAQPSLAAALDELRPCVTSPPQVTRYRDVD